MDESRPNPDALLAIIQRQEAKDRRGRFKIFLGMAAGVGKTFAMLENAHGALADDIDVVVGYVETHGRVETETLIDGLEVIPRQRVEYRGTILEEMDVDAILVRGPELVLVDELAHTNAPGLRHSKRYQDVLELLEAGIDVWTTVNVQHFESRADVVRQITGVTIQETIPDSLLDLADELELIDLTPEELRKRLAEGKVYTPERSDVAARNFFRTGNLTALREMSLRLTAEHVDHQLQDYMDIKRIAGPWKSAERLLVAVGPSPFSERLIRWTRRMGYNLEAPWLAANVQTSVPLSDEAQEQLSRNLASARNLGGEVVTAAGNDVADTLLQIARQRNVTQIVIGKTGKKTWRQLWRRGNMVDQLIDHSGDIDIYVITGDEPDRLKNVRTSPYRPNFNSPRQHYLWAFLAVLAITIIDLMIFNLAPWISHLAVGLTALFVVLIIAAYLGRGPALLAATISAISWNFLFMEPRFTFRIQQVQDVILFFLYFAIAIVAGNLTARLRSQERLARSNAERTTALYSLAHETATAVNMDDVLRAAITQINAVFDADAAILLTDQQFLNRVPHAGSTLDVDEKDYSVASWSYENNKVAGRFTETLPMASAQFRPLRTPNRTVGVLGIRPRQQEPLSFEQVLLLETFTNQIALAIEREILDEASEHAALVRESERLFSTLLNSISHELRTPIATITGAASSLLVPETGADPETRTQLAHDIRDSGNRLNRLVANMLDMSRLESGRLQLKMEWCDVGDVIGVAVKQMEYCLAGRPVTIEVPPDLPLVRLDFILIEQAIVNLLDNACAYTPAGTPIEIVVARKSNAVTIAVTDHGHGVALQDINHVFDKFFRAPGTETGGTGLGLSITRGLVEAHGGQLKVENVRGAGARFTIRLPAETPPPAAEEAKT
jgi:two-component system, OmpR family, sensor histidine kinase KdpD